MKQGVWIGIGAVLLLVGGWLGYRWLRPAGPSVAKLVPPDALLMLASTHLQDTLSEGALRTQMSLRQVPIFDEARQRLDRILYAAADTATTQAFVRAKTIRYSLHPISKLALDYVFYVPLAGADQSFLSRLTNPDPRQYRVLNHTFAGEKIYDLVTRGNEPVGSFILTDDFLIGSVSGILMENVAQRMHQTIARANPQANLRVGADQLAVLSMRPNVLQALFGEAKSLVRLFLPEELNLQFRTSASPTHLIGSAANEIGDRQDVANLFAGQTPRRISQAALIPQTTALLYHVGISDANRFGQALSRLLRSGSGDFIRERFRQIRPATEALYPALGSDLMLCRLESPGNLPRQVLVLPTRDVKRASAAYQQAAYLAGARRAVPRSFLGHKTLRLNVAELPASLFSSLFSGFRQSWITQHGSALIVANSEDAMQDYLQQVQRGEVWSADRRQTELLNGTLRPAHFTALVRLNRSQTVLPAHWPPAWQNLLTQRTADRPTPALANLENIAYQASYGNEKILSTLVLGRTTRRASQAVLNRLLLQKKAEFGAPLIAQPVVVGGLGEGAAPYYVQNAGQFTFVTPEGDPVNLNALDGPIRSNALAVDFLDNGRLQYLFMTDRTLYVADPNRRSTRVEAIRLPPGLDVTYLAQPRGSRPRNLVALAAHADGHIYALNRQQRAWVPLLTAPRKGALLLPFQVINAPTGMEVLAAQADGTLLYWQANGGQKPGFPARIERQTDEEPDVRFAGPALLPTGQTDIRVITDEGQLLSVGPSGLVTKRTQLYRPVRSGSFRLFPDEGQTNWLLLRATDTEVALLDQRGGRRFEVRALQSGRNTVRYHRLGAGVDLISVQSGGFTTLYDLNGQIIGNRPIPSDFPVTVQFDERTNELYVLSAAKNTVQLFSIRIR